MKTRTTYIIEQKEGKDNLFEWEIYQSNTEQDMIEIWLSETSYGIKKFVLGIDWTIEEAEKWIKAGNGQLYIKTYKANLMN